MALSSVKIAGEKSGKKKNHPSTNISSFSLKVGTKNKR